MVMVFNATFKQRLILYNGSHELKTHAQCTKGYNNSACVRWMCNYKIKNKKYLIIQNSKTFNRTIVEREKIIVPNTPIDGSIIVPHTY